MKKMSSQLLSILTDFGKRTSPYSKQEAKLYLVLSGSKPSLKEFMKVTKLPKTTAYRLLKLELEPLLEPPLEPKEPTQVADINKDTPTKNPKLEPGLEPLLEQKEGRTRHRDYVWMKDTSYSKLIKEYEVELVQEAFDILNDWIEGKQPAPGQKPTAESKKAITNGWNSHLTLRRWVIKEAQKRQQTPSDGFNFKDYYGI